MSPAPNATKLTYQLTLTADDIGRLLFELGARRGMITAHDAWLTDMIERLRVALRQHD